MWKIGELKRNARKRMKAGYWKSVVAALVLALVIGGLTAPSINFNFGSTGFWEGFTQGIKDENQDLDDFDETSENIDEAADEFSDQFSEDMSNGDFEAAADDFGTFMDGLDDNITAMVEDSFDSDFFSSMGTSAGDFLRGYLIIILILFVIFLFITTVISILLNIFVCNPFEVGGNNFFVKNHDEESRPSLKTLFISFKGHYRNTVKIMFIRGLFIFLWSLLFIVPGIIKSYEYRMIPYILAENPEISRAEAFEQSRRLMSGNKWKAFVLDLSFIGWSLLAAMTFNMLGIFYTNPYQFQTNAELYFALKEENTSAEMADGYEHYKEID